MPACAAVRVFAVSAGEDLLQMLQSELYRRQQAERDAADARSEARSTETLRSMQAQQISQLNETVAKLHQELQQYRNSSGDLVSGQGLLLARGGSPGC